MNTSESEGLPRTRHTHLVFCHPDVDPDLITLKLGTVPTYSAKVSNPGTWKLDFPGDATGLLVEEQLDVWMCFLAPNTSALAELVALGYLPYLDCRAEKEDLSLCVDPEALGKLAQLGLSLSVWLY